MSKVSSRKLKAMIGGLFGYSVPSFWSKSKGEVLCAERGGETRVFGKKMRN